MYVNPPLAATDIDVGHNDNYTEDFYSEIRTINSTISNVFNYKVCQVKNYSFQLENLKRLRSITSGFQVGLKKLVTWVLSEMLKAWFQKKKKRLALCLWMDRKQPLKLLRKVLKLSIINKERLNSVTAMRLTAYQKQSGVIRAVVKRI